MLTTLCCKFFVWLLLQDRLWTAARLQLRGWSNNPGFITSAWTERSGMEDWLAAAIEETTKAAHSIAILTLWHIWKQRNAIVFNGERCQEQAVFTWITDECLVWASAGERALSYIFYE